MENKLYFMNINKNDKQIYFNQVKGLIEELNDAPLYCSITLKVGHDSFRMVNLNMKKDLFDQLVGNFAIGDKVTAKFYVSSRKKNDRWFSNLSLISMDKCSEAELLDI